VNARFSVDDFLSDRPGPRPLRVDGWNGDGVNPERSFFGEGRHALEVAIASANARPPKGSVRSLWSARHGRQASPLLLVVLYPSDEGWKASLCGPVGDDPPVFADLDVGHAERLADAALDEPDRHSATRFLLGALPQVEGELPGLRNAGMFATHELKSGVPTRADWTKKVAAGKALLSHRGRQLVERLGFRVEDLGPTTHVLRVDQNGTACAIAVFLEESESPDGTSTRFRDANPVSTALARADKERLPYVVLTRGNQIRIYATGKDVGVGRKGRTETFLEADVALLREEDAGYLPLLFGAEALAPGGTFEEVLDRSRNFAADLGGRLRERVYEHVVPALAAALGSRLAEQQDVTTDQLDLDHLYEMAMRVLFRLLFVSYAEDKGLLPFERSEEYRRHALKTKARELSKRANDGALEFDRHGADLWAETLELWKAVDKGRREWQVPPYNGGLFNSDPERSRIGAEIATLSLSNVQFGPVLKELLVDRGDDRVHGPVDFRALSVREFGTIYEGLLEASLSVAPTDLTLDAKGTYVPADSESVVVQKGDVYLQNRSGQRKSTGSYFTKHFAVEHLLDQALEPALDQHVERLVDLHQREGENAAAAAFFDFRCADVAMGSGHFLVAAVDRIEARLSSFLADTPLRNVAAELDRLRKAAERELRELAKGEELEDARLLRRQIARRCIYGVDINEIAVELGRLSIWIHTFVPGLPLSFLNHNLVVGNSLTGIGTIDEALRDLDPGQKDGMDSFFRGAVEEWLGRAESALRRLGRASDASRAEIAEAYDAQQEAMEAVQPARALFDLLVGVRVGVIGRNDLPLTPSDEQVLSHPGLVEAERTSQELRALHFPIAFPEVFLRRPSGFDCLVGNPPWEKVMVEEDKFWAQKFPGYMGQTQKARKALLDRHLPRHPEYLVELEEERKRLLFMREALRNATYPDIGRGHPDLYKAFAWRFWQLVRQEGFVGIVLPRVIVVGIGSETWRRSILKNGRFADSTVLVNRGHWVFDDVHPQWTFLLASIQKGPKKEKAVALRGPFYSFAAYMKGITEEPAVISREAVMRGSKRLVFPLLGSQRSSNVLSKMVESPPVCAQRPDWAVGITQEINSTTGKKYFRFDRPDENDVWPVYKGSSFNLWEPDTGEYYAWIGEGDARRLSKKRITNIQYVDKIEVPACLLPRVAFRKMSRSTDTRTILCALIPGKTLLADHGSIFVWERGSVRDEAYLLGVLSSIPFDWFARRYVEANVSIHLMESFPVPVRRNDRLSLLLSENSARLAAADDRYKEWAAAVGVEPGSVESEQNRADMIAQNDALVSRLYGLSEEDVRHIFETFHAGGNYSGRLSCVLDHFRSLPERD